MNRQYNFSPERLRTTPEPATTALALDAGSPVVSVAISVGGEVLAEKTAESQHSSSHLLQLVDRCLDASGIAIHSLDLLIGIRGPGSFTGLRVGLSTLQGMRMALKTQAATVTTFQVLASLGDEQPLPVTACVDALRDEWMLQEFPTDWPASQPAEPVVRSREEIGALRSTCLIGFGVSRLRACFGSASEVTLIEPGPLAPQALRLLSAPHLFDRQSDALSTPLYLKPPAAARPRPRFG